MNNKYFFCYDVNLRNYLVSNNYVYPITYALHPKTKNQFWLFETGVMLSDGIESYKKAMDLAKAK